MRSKWMARRLWMVSLAESSWAAWSHWRRLEPAERNRLLALARKSKGRPSNLSNRERAEVDELLEKLGHMELVGTVAATWLPFGWASRLATKAIGPRARISRRDPDLADRSRSARRREPKRRVGSRG
jgi:hypothetical protein